MPPDTLWTGNPNLKVSISQGNVSYDDASTTYDASVYYDGAPNANLVSIYRPINTLWTVQMV